MNLEESGKRHTGIAMATVIHACLWSAGAALAQDSFTGAYVENCATCHAPDLTGTGRGPALVGGDLAHGNRAGDLRRSIVEGFPDRGMPSFGQTLTDTDIARLVLFIAEQRQGFSAYNFRVYDAIALPDGVMQTEETRFKVEQVVSGLAPLPFSIAAMPDGSILLTEKMRGIRVISPSGEVSAPVPGTPKAHDGGFGGPRTFGLIYGTGWLLDIAPHPDYATNGWIYLHHSDRCRACNARSLATFGVGPVGMNRIVRARIRDGRWVDEQVIWSVPRSDYTLGTDVAAGGRLAFDGAGHLFFSVGFRGPSVHEGIQDLSTPTGKIHRIRDDGSMPADNPFRDTPGALPSIWSYGHRNPQGLEYDSAAKQLWSTEMGPRGGDEVNLILSGRNYGWPLTSKGMNYEGTPVDYGRQLGIEWKMADIEQPVVDLTPSPAVSSFQIYTGAAFPSWHGDLIVGSLKARTLYRMRRVGNQVVHIEKLLQGIGRIRDVGTDRDGRILLLLESNEGSQIVRLVPAP